MYKRTDALLRIAAYKTRISTQFLLIAIGNQHMNVSFYILDGVDDEKNIFVQFWKRTIFLADYYAQTNNLHSIYLFKNVILNNLKACWVWAWD